MSNPPLPQNFTSKYEASIREQNYFENLENVFDYWANENISKINLKAKMLNAQAFITDPDVQKFVSDSNNLIKSIDSFENDFNTNIKDVFANTPPSQSIPNIMPYGDQDADPFQLLSYKNIKESGTSFFKLFSDIYENNYEGYELILNNSYRKNISKNSRFTKEFNNLLLNSYESLLAYPKIKFNQIGLGSVTKLADIFVDNYINNNFDKTNFYNSFIENTGYKIFVKKSTTLTPFIGNLKDLSEGFYKMNHDLWFSTSNTDFDNVGMDSYGTFFKRKPLLGNPTSPSFIFQSLKEVDKGKGLMKPDLYNINYGLINLPDNTSTNSVYTFDPDTSHEKISLCLYTKYFDINTNRPQLFDYFSTNNLSTGYDNSLNQYYYNFNIKYVKAPGSGSSYKLPTQPPAPPQKEINLTNLIQDTSTTPPSNFKTNLFTIPTTSFQSSPIDLLQTSQQTGGKKYNKKNKRGGKVDMIFDLSAGPGLSARRRNVEFDKNNFIKILTEFSKFFPTFDKTKSKEIDDIIKKLVNLPIFYDNKSDWRKLDNGTNSFELNYNDLRKINVFCNVLSNHFKLVTHFFENIKIIIESIKKEKVSFLKKNLSNIEQKGNVNESYLKTYQKFTDLSERGIDELLKSITLAITIIKYITTDIDLPAKSGTPQQGKQTNVNDLLLSSQGQTVKNLFLGINIPFLLAMTGENLETIINNYLFLENGNFSKTKFVNLIRKISTFFDPVSFTSVVFGGLSLVTVDPDYMVLNENVWSCYSFVIKLRKLSNENFYDAYTNKINTTLTNLPEKQKIQIQNDVNNLLQQLGGRQGLQAIFAPATTLQVKLQAINSLLTFFYGQLKTKLNNVLLTKTSFSRTNNSNPIRKLVQQIYGTAQGIYDQRSIKIYTDFNNFKYMIQAIITQLKLYLNISPTIPGAFLSRQLWRWCSIKFNLMISIYEYFIGLNVKTNKNLNSLKNRLTNLGIKVSSNQNRIKLDESFLTATDVINPNYSKEEWWYKNYYTFQQIKPSFVNKVFIFATLISPDKTSVSFYLIDLFAATFSKDLSVAVRKDIKIDFLNNKPTWSDENIIIRLEPDEVNLGFRGISKERLPNIKKEFSQRIKSSIFKIKNTLKRSLGISTTTDPALLAKSYRNKKFIQNKQTSLVTPFLQKYYNETFIPITNLINKTFDCRQPVLNVFNEPQKFANNLKLNPLFLASDNYQSILNNLFLAPFTAKPIEYPIFILPNAEILTNIGLFRRWACELIFSLPNLQSTTPSLFYTKYVISTSKLRALPIQEKIPGLFDSNLLLIENLYDQIIKKVPVINPAVPINYNQFGNDLIDNGFITQDNIQEVLL